MTQKTMKRRPTPKAARRASAKPAGAEIDAALTPRAVMRAGLGVAERMQGEALKVYRALAEQAETIRTMTTEAAQTLAQKTGVLVSEGQKIQARAVAKAQAQADATAKEVKAFAKKSQKNLKANIGKTMDTTVGNAKEGITKLEHVFEARVARTLNTFGVPSAQNVRELQARMADLQKALNQLNKQRFARG